MTSGSSSVTSKVKLILFELPLNNLNVITMSDREEELHQQSSSVSEDEAAIDDEAWEDSEEETAEDNLGTENEIVDDDGDNASAGYGELVVEDISHTFTREPTPYSFNSSPYEKKEMFESNLFPFHGRDAELGLLYQAIDRINLEWMENQSEVVLISGDAGVGKSSLVDEALKRSLVDTKTTIVCRTSCEENHLASRPFDALVLCMESLCDKLQKFGGENEWKPRFEEALGGEGPFLATVVPKVGTLMDVKPIDSRRLMAYDVNSRHRFERLAFAIRDFLKAVSESHPLIMIVDNIHWADLDSMRILQDLVSTKTLSNFLFIGSHEPVGEGHPFESFKQIVTIAGTRVTKMELDPFDRKTVEEILGSLLLDESEDDKALDQVKDLAKTLHSFTNGNTLYIMATLHLLHDKNILIYNESHQRFDWQKLKVKKQIKKWRDGNDKILESISSVFKARVEGMRQKHRFAVEVIASLGLTNFRLNGYLTRLVNVAWIRKDKDCPIKSDNDLKVAVNKACNMGIFEALTDGCYKFAHDCIRQGAYSYAATKLKNSSGRNMHMFIGNELSKISAEVKSQQRFKFMSVDQLNRCAEIINQEELAKLCRLNQEAAEFCIMKTSFRSAIEYLKAGMKLLDIKSSWIPNNYDVTLRNYLYLARMNVCCSELDSAKKGCRDIFKYTTSLKDKIFASNLMFDIMVEEENYEEALSRILALLQRMGETFPTGQNVPKIIEKEFDGIRKSLRKKDNKQLLTPPKNSDKKSLDALFLLATLVDISEKYNDNYYKELAIMRMMHLSLKFGYSRQYPLAFALFGVYLVQQGFIKEAYRYGQIAERMGKGTDYYGGKAVMLFYLHISHWRRNYRRCLEPILTIYNAQLDSGDFHNADFSITTYIQYHLASGFELERLDENLILFDGLFLDYNLSDRWRIVIAREVVANLMGGTEFPLVFFGDTLEQQSTALVELNRLDDNKALEYFNFMRLFMAIFFHDFDLAQDCFSNLEQSPEGVWVLWSCFFEALVLISHLPGTKGKDRKELKERIESKKGQLIEWNNEGAKNAGAMASLLEIEYLVAKEAGKILSTYKVQGLFDEAIEAAKREGAAHLHAFACERAGMYFDITGVNGLAATYLRRAHRMYDRWNAVAKVIHIEGRFADILDIQNPRTRPAGAAFIYQNGHIMQNEHEHTIGGGQKKVKSLNVMKIGKRGLHKAKKAQGIFGKKGNKEGLAEQFDDFDEDDGEIQSPSSYHSSKFAGKSFLGKIKSPLSGKSTKRMVGHKLAAQEYD